VLVVMDYILSKAFGMASDLTGSPEHVRRLLTTDSREIAAESASRGVFPHTKLERPFGRSRAIRGTRRRQDCARRDPVEPVSSKWIDDTPFVHAATQHRELHPAQTGRSMSASSLLCSMRRFEQGRLEVSSG